MIILPSDWLMTAPAQICGIIKSSGNSLQMVVERGDHIVPNFEEIWPSDKNKDDKYKRRLIGMEYYMDVRNYRSVCYVALRKMKAY